MAEPWDPKLRRDEPVELIKWNPALHPRIKAGNFGGGRFLSIAKGAGQAAKARGSRVRDAIPTGARKRDAPLAGFLERRRAPKLKAGQKYARVAELPALEDVGLGKVMFAAMRRKNPYAPRRRLAIAESGPAARTKMGTLHTERGEIEDVAPATIPGERKRKQLSGGMMAQRVDKVQVGGNRWVVHKIGDVKSTDAEELSGKIAGVLGTKEEFPVAERLGRNQHVVPFVSGTVLLDKRLEPGYAAGEPAMLATPESRRIGAIDFLTGNPDRNLGNIMVQTFGNRMTPAAIDMGEAFSLPDVMEAGVFGPAEWQHIPSNPNGQLFSVAMFAAMDEGQKMPFNPHDWTEGLRGLAPEFEKLGRGEWHEQMMARHKILTDYYDGAYSDKPKEGLNFQPASIKQPEAKDLPQFRALEELGRVHEDDDGVWQPGPHPGGQRALAERDARRKAATAAAAAKPDSESDLADPVRQHRVAREQFESEVDAWVSGEIKTRNATPLTGGMVNAGVTKVELDNGRVLVDKLTDVPKEPEREEFISQHLAPQLGVKVPHAVVTTTERGRLTMEFVDGTLGEEVPWETENSPEFRRQARMVGAMDALTGNPDRNDGNWIWRDGELVAIDNGMGFQPNRFNAKKVIQMSGGAGTWARDAYRNLSLDEWYEIRENIKKIQPSDGGGRGYKEFLLSNVNAIIKSKKDGTDWSVNLVRTSQVSYNWGMYPAVVDLARDWNPDLHPRLFNGRFMRVSDSSRGWGDDPHLDPRVDDWNPAHSRRERARGMAYDARPAHSAPVDSDDAHHEQIGLYNDRFWRAAGVSINDDGSSPETYHGDDRPLRQAVVDAAPEFQRDRLREIVHDDEFMDDDLRAELADIHEDGGPGTLEEASQAVLNRAYDMWDREYGDRERFASGFDPSPVPDELEYDELVMDAQNSYLPELDDDEAWIRLAETGMDDEEYISLQQQAQMRELMRRQQRGQ